MRIVKSAVSGSLPRRRFSVMDQSEHFTAKLPLKDIGVRPIPVWQASTKKANPHFRLMDLYSWKSSYGSNVLGNLQLEIQFLQISFSVVRDFP